jgi:phage tail-like protein
MSETTLDPAVSVCFKVKIDEHDLGAFTGCDGLGCEVVMEQREEGGNNAFVHQLPSRIKYSNVKLTRAVNADTQKIATWFASIAGGVKRTTAHIAAMTVEGKEVWHWNLQGVVPVRWQGPSMSVDSAKVATETLELAHHGFLPG